MHRLGNIDMRKRIYGLCDTHFRFLLHIRDYKVMVFWDGDATRGRNAGLRGLGTSDYMVRYKAA